MLRGWGARPQGGSLGVGLDHKEGGSLGVGLGDQLIGVVGVESIGEGEKLVVLSLDSTPSITPSAEN